MKILEIQTLAFMESNYPVSHLPSPLPSLCPILPSPPQGFEEKVKTYMGKIYPEIP